MSSSPFVSIVMPSLNQVQFLEASVRSVLEQDYTRLELIISDGMSTDGSVDLLIKLQSQFKDKIRWISQKDSGPAQAINKAIQSSQGEIIGWLNSDDVYLPGAISRAVEHFSQQKTHQMVYGLASYIGLNGESLGSYPTKPPSTPLDDFANGSFICQPTVFVRRKAIENVGLLDESIATAFDFDWFIRFFKRYPRRIGIIRRLQAASRLHPTCLTQRMRRQVAIDAMKVVTQHLAEVPDHWFWTHIDEICEAYPFGPDQQPLLKQLEIFLKEAKVFYSPDALKKIIERLKSDYRFGLNSAELYATVQPDGWVSKQVVVKYRWNEKPATAVLMTCNAAWPEPGVMKLKVSLPDGHIQRSEVEAPAQFVLRLEVPPVETSGFISWTVEALQGFVPAKHNKSSDDDRKLSFRVSSLKLEA